MLIQVRKDARGRVKTRKRRPLEQRQIRMLVIDAVDARRKAERAQGAQAKR